MLLKVNTLEYTCIEKYRHLMSRYLLVSCTTLNTWRRPRILGEEPNINDELNPKEISGPQWDGKLYTATRTKRVCVTFQTVSQGNTNLKIACSVIFFPFRLFVFLV